jgi:hypothetical protein
MGATMMTSRIGEHKREDKADAPRPATSDFDSQKSSKMKEATLFLSIRVASGVLIISVYNSLVDAKSWALIFQRLFKWPETAISVLTSRRFYTVIGPLNQLLSLLTMEREKLSPPVPAYIAHRTWREARRRFARDGSAASDSR